MKLRELSTSYELKVVILVLLLIALLVWCFFGMYAISITCVIMYVIFCHIHAFNSSARGEYYEYGDHWINTLITHWWIFNESKLDNLMKEKFKSIKIPFGKLELVNVKIGKIAPKLDIHSVDHRNHHYNPPVHPNHDSMSFPLSWKTVDIKAVVVFDGEEFQANLLAKVSILSMEIAVKKLNFVGKMKLSITYDYSTNQPHISRISCTFLEPPYVDVNLKVWNFQITSIPLMKSLVYGLMMNYISKMIHPKVINLI